MKNNKRNYCACYDGITSVLVCEVAILVYINNKPVIRNLKAFWDTGSASSAISQKIVKELELPVYKPDNIITSITGQNVFNSYIVNVYLNDKMRFNDVEVFGAEMKNVNYEFVIGMDIIKQGNLIVKNGNKTILKFERKNVGWKNLHPINKL